MKRCPTCNKTFSDQNLSFCVDDGTPLLPVIEPVDSADEATIVNPSYGADGRGYADERDAPAYQPPGAYTPPGYDNQSKRRTWPWILGTVLIVGVMAGLGIFALRLIRNIARVNSDIHRKNDSAANLNEQNSNAGSAASNTNENVNDNSNADDTTPPPKDSQKVLADLKNLEDEWTVANINADKKKLDRLLADDYVGITEGRAQGKAEYLTTIERDTAIQHWEFDDLKVSLNGDRASLSGVLRLEVKDEQGQDHALAYRFTDKFVWRDGRWQAVASEVNPLKEGTAV